MSAEIDLSSLAKRWLGKTADQVTESERGVLARVHGRLPVSRRPLAADQRPATLGERVADRVASFGGSWPFIGLFGAFLVLWVLVNTWGADAGWTHVDEPPFFWLQGIVSSNALLLTVAVLIRQNRMAQLAEHRAHLDLQINLLTEQKATKILKLVDELRRELPALRGQSDAEVAELTKPADADAILKAIKQLDDER